MARWSELDGTLFVEYCALDVCKVSSLVEASIEYVSRGLLDLLPPPPLFFPCSNSSYSAEELVGQACEVK